MADGAVFANIGDRLKNNYTKLVTRQFAKNQILFALCDRDSKKVPGGGTTAIWFLHTDRNASAGSYPDGGPYPRFGQQSGVQANAKLKNQFTGCQFEEKTLYAAANDKQAFFNVEKYEIKRALEDIKNSIARQMWNDSSAVLGGVASVAISGANTVVTLSPTAVPRYSPLTLFLVNQGYYTFLTSTFGVRANGASVQISNVNGVAGTFTYVTATGPTLSAGDLITTETGNQTGAASGGDLQGVRSIFGTQSIFGVDTTKYSSFTSFVRNQNDDPTEQMISILKQQVIISGSKADVIVTHPLVVTKYTNLLLLYKRSYIEAGRHEIFGGVESTEDVDILEGPEFIDLGPMIADNNCPQGINASTNFMAVYDTEHLFIQEVPGGIHWRDKDGAIMARVTGNPSSPFYQANLEWFGEVGSDKRNGLALHTNVNQQI